MFDRHHPKSKSKYHPMKHISFIFIILPFLSFSQKIKKLPVTFLAPISFDSQSQRDKFAISKGVSGKEYWLVIGDRPKVALYDNPKGNPTSELFDYGQTAYVIDESGEWIKVGIGSREDNRFRNLIKSGWVKKTDVLLWSRALRNKETYVREIIFTGLKLSNLSDIVQDLKHIKVFDSPTSYHVDKEINNIIYYIYKEEQGRVLLGTTDYFNQTNVKEVLVGWVDTAYIHRWNSRLALECNWEEPSYSQRKSDSTKRVYGFNDQVSADLYGKTGFFKKENIICDNDPAKSDFPKGLRAEENNRRLVGDVFRFPVFDMTSGYIKSAGLVKIENDKMETEPIKSFVERNLSEATQTKIRQEKPRVVVDMYLPILIPGVEKPYKYIILMSEAELEEYVSQLRDLKRAMNAPEDVIREQLYNTVVSIILKMSGDTRTRKQIDNMDFAEFMAWVASMKREGIPIDLKGISIKDILDKKKLPSDELNNWAANLLSKEENLASIARQNGTYPYSFTVGEAVYFWLDEEDLTW